MSIAQQNEINDLKKRIVILETLIGDLHGRVDELTSKKASTPAAKGTKSGTPA